MSRYFLSFYIGKTFWHHLNSKHNAPVLLLKSIFRHLKICFLSSVAMDGEDGHELYFEKVG